MKIVKWLGTNACGAHDAKDSRNNDGLYSCKGVDSMIATGSFECVCYLLQVIASGIRIELAGFGFFFFFFCSSSQSLFFISTWLCFSNTTYIMENPS